MQGVGRLLFEGTSSPARHTDTTSISIAKDRYRIRRQARATARSVASLV